MQSHASLTTRLHEIVIHHWWRTSWLFWWESANAQNKRKKKISLEINTEMRGWSETRIPDFHLSSGICPKATRWLLFTTRLFRRIKLRKCEKQTDWVTLCTHCLWPHRVKWCSSNEIRIQVVCWTAWTYSMCIGVKSDVSQLYRTRSVTRWLPASIL